MSSDRSTQPPMIRAEGLGKEYRLGDRGGTYRTLRERLPELVSSAFRPRRGDLETKRRFWALREVDFEVRRGEILGIVGHNGAGKTTLLKLLSRITEPTEGRAEIRGRVGSLLEVGTGFHPELTGRENLYLSSAILGMRKVEIDRRLDEIVEFAEIGRFLDTPIKRYSTGMRVRLAFSVAAHLDPDVLLVDEVLAVGDFAFQNKCLGKMGSLHEGGRTILLVSHDLSVIRRLATRVLWLDGGRVAGCGPTLETIAAYLDSGSADLRFGDRFPLVDHPSRPPRFQPHFREIRLRAGDEPGLVPMGEALEIEIDFTAEEDLAGVYPTFSIEDGEGYSLYRTNPRVSGDVDTLPASTRGGTFRCRLDGLPLNPGVYYLTLFLHEGQRQLDQVDRACRFEVVARDIYGSGQVVDARQGFLAWPSDWEFEAARRSDARD